MRVISKDAITIDVQRGEVITEEMQRSGPESAGADCSLRRNTAEASR